MRLVAVIPAYNEEARVDVVVNAVRPLVDMVIVVNDGSTDATATKASAAGALVLSHPENFGAGAATMTGIEAARHLHFDHIVTIDADGQHDCSDIQRMVTLMSDTDVDLVIANRFGRKNFIPFIRRFANALGNILTFLVTGLFVPDSQCGFKLFGPRAVAQINLMMPGFEFCTEIIREAAHHRWKIVSLPTKVLYSEYTLAKGQSFANGLRTASKILLRSFLR